MRRVLRRRRRRDLFDGGRGVNAAPGAKPDHKREFSRLITNKQKPVPSKIKGSLSTPQISAKPDKLASLLSTRYNAERRTCHPYRSATVRIKLTAREARIDAYAVRQPTPRPAPTQTTKATTTTKPEQPRPKPRHKRLEFSDGVSVVSSRAQKMRLAPCSEHEASLENQSPREF